MNTAKSKPALTRALLGTVCLLFVGFFVWSARSGLLEVRAQRAENTCYNLLVRSLRAGRLNLPLELPPGFAQLASAYDAPHGIQA